MGKLFYDVEFNRLLPKKFKNEQIEWKRIPDICKNPKFIVNDFDIKDICQGDIGSCWLLGSLISLVQNLNLFFRIVNPLQCFDDNFYDGKFIFNFFKDGNLTKIEIDDYLPVNDSGELIFSKNNIETNEFWVCLIEKAFAKLLGSYCKLNEGGDVLDASQYLFGSNNNFREDLCPGKEHSIYNIIEKFLLNKSSIITCSIYDSNGKNSILKNKLVPNHSYCIIAVDRLTKNITLKNPWANEVEYNEKINDQDNCDGIFTISLSNFIRDFDFLSIGYINLSQEEIFFNHNLSKFHNFELLHSSIYGVESETFLVKFCHDFKHSINIFIHIKLYDETKLYRYNYSVMLKIKKNFLVKEYKFLYSERKDSCFFVSKFKPSKNHYIYFNFDKNEKLKLKIDFYYKKIYDN